MLYDIIPMIKGRWWLCGGAMLGLCRDNDLISYDNDLDIMLFPGSEIVLPNDSNYSLQKYYMDTKFYRNDLPVYKPNLWNEYCRYFGHGKKINRCELYKQAKLTYKQERIEPKFSNPYIDIYTLKKVDGGWAIPYWEHQIYYDKELENTIVNTDLGFPVYLPGDTELVCERCYGNNWREPLEDNWKKKN